MEVSPKHSSTQCSKIIVSSDQTVQVPWVEKYRPAKLEDLVAHEDIVSILTRLIDSDNLPHLLLYGPPGTGKVRGEIDSTFPPPVVNDCPFHAIPSSPVHSPLPHTPTIDIYHRCRGKTNVWFNCRLLFNGT